MNEKLQKDVKEFLDKKIGKKYICCISYQTEKQGQSASSVFGNVDFSKDPFDVVKGLLAGLQTASSGFVQKVSGVTTSENKPEKEHTSYHQ
ncbi:hypothetical protein KKB44_01580 [Candidatus Micrarchaeota archaeon]|nr:hypothetical protein [Candidatus Micrarchaeota archaeon]